MSVIKGVIFVSLATFEVSHSFLQRYWEDEKNEQNDGTAAKKGGGAANSTEDDAPSWTVIRTSIATATVTEP
jgi:hypothetical protein